MERQYLPRSSDLEKSPSTWCCSEPSLRNADLRQIYQERWIIPISNHVGCLDSKYIRAPNNSGGSPMEMRSVDKTHTKALNLYPESQPWSLLLHIQIIIITDFTFALNFTEGVFLLRPVHPLFIRFLGHFWSLGLLSESLLCILQYDREVLIVASDPVCKKWQQNHQGSTWGAKGTFSHHETHLLETTASASGPFDFTPDAYPLVSLLWAPWLFPAPSYSECLSASRVS